MVDSISLTMADMVGNHNQHMTNMALMQHLRANATLSSGNVNVTTPTQPIGIQHTGPTITAAHIPPSQEIRFEVCWGTFRDEPNVLMLTGNYIYWKNLPPALQRWLERRNAVNSIRSMFLGPSGHYLIAYRRKNRQPGFFHSPGIEAILGINHLIEGHLYSTAWSNNAYLTLDHDLQTNHFTMISHNLPPTLDSFIQSHNVTLGNLRIFELGSANSWLLATTDFYAFDNLGNELNQELARNGNTFNAAISLGKTSQAHFYIETPSRRLFHVPTPWIPEVQQHLDRPARSDLPEGYYDELRQVHVIPALTQRGVLTDPKEMVAWIHLADTLTQQASGGGNFDYNTNNVDTDSSGCLGCCVVM